MHVDIMIMLPGSCVVCLRLLPVVPAVTPFRDSMLVY